MRGTETPQRIRNRALRGTEATGLEYALHITGGASDSAVTQEEDLASHAQHPACVEAEVKWPIRWCVSMLM